MSDYVWRVQNGNHTVILRCVHRGFADAPCTTCRELTRRLSIVGEGIAEYLDAPEAEPARAREGRQTNVEPGAIPDGVYPLRD